MPVWALAIAADIAILTDDPEAAEARLRELVARGHQPTTGRLLIASYLQERGLTAEALAEVEDVSGGAIAPEDRLRVSQLLLQLEQPAAAVQAAFEAFREKPDDPQFHRVFASIVLAARVELLVPQSVGVDTFVELAADDGEHLEYSVYEHGTVNALRGELTRDQAEEMGLFGLAVGDILEGGHRPTWAGSRFRVTAITPALVHAFQDVIGHYEERFPTEPWFVSRFAVGDGGSLGDFAPIVGSLVSKRERIRELLETYRTGGLPMGFIAGLAGGSIADLIDFLGSGDDRPPVLAEWSDASMSAASVAAARAADFLVVTRSALKTMDDLGLLDTVADAYSLVAPRSLLRALEAEIRDAGERVMRGHNQAYATDGGIGVEDLPPNDPRLVGRRTEIERQITFVRTPPSSRAGRSNPFARPVAVICERPLDGTHMTRSRSRRRGAAPCSRTTWGCARTRSPGALPPPPPRPR